MNVRRLRCLKNTLSGALRSLAPTKHGASPASAVCDKRECPPSVSRGETEGVRMNGGAYIHSCPAALSVLY